MAVLSLKRTVSILPDARRILKASEGKIVCDKKCRTEGEGRGNRRAPTITTDLQVQGEATALQGSQEMQKSEFAS